jgi:hypothetical protein
MKGALARRARRRAISAFVFPSAASSTIFARNTSA